MMRLLAYLLTTLLLLQTIGQELLVLHFTVNQAALTARFCVNKTRAALRCHGKCYLAKQLRRAENGTTKAPAGAWAKIKLEVVAPSPFQLRVPGWAGSVAAPRYAPAAAHPDAAAPGQGIFHPPAWLS